jgi:uncharacterized protein YndB with AHSA1/START domain
MIDVIREIEAVQRSVASAPLGTMQGHAVRLRREYSAPIDDVWDALTNPERIGRWFLPISGDYRLGGTYQFEGNAGGRIVACERPSRLRVTWVYGPPSDAPDSEVEVRLTAADGERTVLELEHLAVVPDEFWDQFGPGAVGVGWDGGFLGLALHLRGGSVDDPLAWQLSDEGRAFNTASSESWGDASRAAGEPADVVAQQVAATTTFYTVDPSAATQEG